jgi:hypothetical protein
MNKVYKCYSDSGHGWLAVKRKELIDLGIANKISHYSYQRGATVYLEEDGDATLFVNTYAEKFGGRPQMKSGAHCDTSPIRSYERFHNV